MLPPLIYLPVWFLRAKFLGHKAPLQTVIFISDKCNLSCKHCSVYNHSNPITKSYDTIAEELTLAYNKGARFVDFEGGEPFIWRDGERTVNDLFALAKQIGYFSTTVTTNAQLPFDHCTAQSIWVSLDGIGEHHDKVRGKGAFARLERNIANNPHPHISVNMVVNADNYIAVEETIEYAKNHPHIDQISINFHTPYPGTEQLNLDWNKRIEVIDKVIALKKRGYPIMNSVSGLKRMKDLNFKKQCWVSSFILTDGSYHDQCIGYETGMCDRCGFAMAGEMRSLFDLKFDTIWAGTKLRL